MPPCPRPKIPGPLKSLVDVNFLDYAAYVIRDRAIPDLDDGLKPVQRRILWSLHEKDDGKLIKVANIAGYCMQYHPHGDASINDALVTLANKQYLIEGQGNFGNVLTGDPAAASRYIECRLTELARTELFNDALTRFMPSYDGRNKEPVVLPCKIPLLLMLGADGIAVGLATRILPHNFIELLQAQIAILQQEAVPVCCPTSRQGGLMDVGEYDKGNGKVKVRAVIEKRSELAAGHPRAALRHHDRVADPPSRTRPARRRSRSARSRTSRPSGSRSRSSSSRRPTPTRRQALYAFTQCEVSVSSNLLVIHDAARCRWTSTRSCATTPPSSSPCSRRAGAGEQALLDELHNKSLVQIFVENRIYKRIEKCETYEAVRKAVLTASTSSATCCAAT
jgi:topoisomerase-4 subunit A